MEVKGKRKILREPGDVKDKKKARIEEESGGLCIPGNDTYKASLLQVSSLIRSMTHKTQRSNFDVPLRSHRRVGSGIIDQSMLTSYVQDVREVPSSVGSVGGHCMVLLQHIVCLIRSMAFESEWSRSNLGLGPQEVHESQSERKLPTNVPSGEIHCSVVALLSQVERLIHSTTPKSEFSNLSRQGPVLSEEIILYEILPWLPLDSLFRCKLVCKEWNKVISGDSMFRVSHSQRCVRHPPGLLYRGVSGNNIFLDPSMKCIAMKDMDLIASSNGLVCGSYRKGQIEYFKVMNPVTNEGVYIRNSCRLKNVTLAFEPSGCCPYFALVGWYVTNAEHDVKSHILTMGFSLYSSETGRWSVAKARVAILRKCMETDWPRSECRSVYVGGKVYWKYAPDVFWFDIKEDTAGTVTIPNPEEEFPSGEIGGMNGELTYCAISAEDIVIWVLRANENKWFQKFCVLLTDMFKDISGNIPSCCDNAVIRLLGKRSKVRSRRKNHAISGDRCALPYEGGDLLFWGIHSMQSREGMIFSYNMETKSLRILHNSQMKRWGHCVFSYRRSRASVLKLLSNNTS